MPMRWFAVLIIQIFAARLFTPQRQRTRSPSSTENMFMLPFMFIADALRARRWYEQR